MATATGPNTAMATVTAPKRNKQRGRSVASSSFECVKKALASPIHGGGGRAKRGRRGFPLFSEKWEFQNICCANILAPPGLRPPPLINEGGKIVGSLTSCTPPAKMAGGVHFMFSFAAALPQECRFPWPGPAGGPHFRAGPSRTWPGPPDRAWPPRSHPPAPRSCRNPGSS